jgi:hypothetical protein
MKMNVYVASRLLLSASVMSITFAFSNSIEQC